MAMLPSLPISPSWELLSPFALFFLGISVLILIPISIHHAISSTFQILGKTHFSWPLNSPFHPSTTASSNGSSPVGGDGKDDRDDDSEDDSEELGVVFCKPKEGSKEELLQCAVCLCNIEEGQETRELRCEHLFHRGCLDTWLGYRHMTCPICREAVPKQVAGKLAGWEEGDESEELMSQYSSFLGSINPHLACFHDSSLSLY